MSERVLLAIQESRLVFLPRLVGHLVIIIGVPVAAKMVGLPYLVDRALGAQYQVGSHLLLVWLGISAVALLLLLTALLGRQRVHITTERIVVEEGFWTRRQDEVENFRIRDIVMWQSFLQRLLGIGNVVILATAMRSEEQQVLRSVRNPSGIREAVRNAWRQAEGTRGVSRVD